MEQSTLVIELRRSQALRRENNPPAINYSATRPVSKDSTSYPASALTGLYPSGKKEAEQYPSIHRFQLPGVLLIRGFLAQLQKSFFDLPVHIGKIITPGTSSQIPSKNSLQIKEIAARRSALVPSNRALGPISFWSLLRLSRFPRGKANQALA